MGFVLYCHRYQRKNQIVFKNLRIDLIIGLAGHSGDDDIVDVDHHDDDDDNVDDADLIII